MNSVKQIYSWKNLVPSIEVIRNIRNSKIVSTPRHMQNGVHGILLLKKNKKKSALPELV